MFFTKLNEIPASRSVISTFRGYNHNLRIGSGEFYDMKNMTGDHYPVLSPRAPRRYDSARNPAVWNPTKSKPQAMLSLDGLCFLSDGILYYGYQGGLYQSVDLELSSEESDFPKSLVKFGSYLIVLPDKKYFNTQNKEDRGSIETVWTRGEEEVSLRLCDIRGEEFAFSVRSDTAPVDPEDGQYWLDTSKYRTEFNAELKQYSVALAQWTVVSPTYVKIGAPGIGKGFEEGDCVAIEADTVSIPELKQLTVKTHLVSLKGDDFLVVNAALPDVLIDGDVDLTVSRKMPQMDFIFEHENRLWGCRYGFANNGEFVNEIYASKLGDFKNWNSFQGISTDSYAASCGTDGPWTGAIKAMGYPLFFKENYLHKVYGSYPAEYQIQTIPCRGVQEGCEKSLATVNEVLFYKSRSDVCAYDGSLPVSVSEALGNVKYTDAVAGGVGDKYYISMKDAKGAYQLFCLDTQKGFWHKEDSMQVESFCTVGDELFYIEPNTPFVRILCGDGGVQAEESVSWFAETGPLGTDEPDHKYLSRIAVRLSMALGTRVRILAQYDSMGSWENLISIVGRNLNSFSISMCPKRCDHLRLRIEGEGEAKIYSITLTTEQGSDIR